MIRYRDLYESSTSLLLYNIIKDLAAIVAMAGFVKLKKKNRPTANGKEICGVILREEGMFIITSEDTLIEVSDDNEEFESICSNPYNIITLYENVCKELGLTDKKRKKKNGNLSKDWNNVQALPVQW